MNFKKVCLINPPTTRGETCLFFPTGLVVLGTILKNHGIPVEILDFDLMLRQQPQLRNSYENFCEFFLEQIIASRAEIFGFSSICSNFATTLKLAEKIRSKLPHAKIILGGPQPSSVPRKTMEVFPFIDAIVIGEGERTFLDLLTRPWQPESLRQVLGIAFREQSQVHLTPPRPLIEDLDELPIPDFGLVDLPSVISHNPFVSIVEAGRGCPFRCTFCSTAEFWSRKYRAKSPGRILAEMSSIHQQYGMTVFELIHDNFTTSPKYLKKFCEYFIEHNREGLQWTSSARTDTLKVPQMSTLAKAGCRGLFLGVDSGSERIQDAIDKHLDLNGFKQIVQEAVRHDILIKASFIIGFPDETKEELEKTILLGMWAKNQGAHSVAFHRLAPLAGTKIYHENRSKLFFNPRASDISIQALDAPEIWELIQRHPDLFSSYFSIPTPHLDPIELFQFSKFYNTITNQVGPGLKWLFKGEKSRPTQLYEDWKEYIRVDYPRGVPDDKVLLDSFLDFI